MDNARAKCPTCGQGVAEAPVVPAATMLANTARDLYLRAARDEADGGTHTAATLRKRGLNALDAALRSQSRAQVAHERSAAAS